MERGANLRDVVWIRSLPEWKGGEVTYVRGTEFKFIHRWQIVRHRKIPEITLFRPLIICVYVLKEFQIEYGIDKDNPSIKNPILTISRGNKHLLCFLVIHPTSTVVATFKISPGRSCLHQL